MRIFREQLSVVQPTSSPRQWIYVAYDQLNAGIGPLARTPPHELGIVLLESSAKAARRPYHKQKLALVLSNQRHFALEQAARGVRVRYEASERGYAEQLRALATELGPLTMMRGAERELRVELAPLVSEGVLREVAHDGFLSTREDFVAAVGPRAPWRMDAFYKHMRRKTGVLMRGGNPEGDKFSFDTENRKPWRGQPPAPTPPRFEPDAITKEVGELIAKRFASHPGTLELTRLPASAADAKTWWEWARAECLPHFGPFEDAMSRESATLFHTGVSQLLNLHRLLPGALVADVEHDARVPLASREGFIRQILGWREFVRHVHELTDGFRTIGDAPSSLGAHLPLPPAFWGTPSGLACLDHVVRDVWRDGYSHHITRLMILGNLATLIGIEPREVSDWFWVAYTDAYDWVVEPNVLAMATYGTGEVMTTKPYISGAAYIDRMSDYCDGCAFDPRTTCPITRMYWALLADHASRFGRNPRMAGPLASLGKRSEEEREKDARVRERVRERLARGETLDPASLADQ